MKNEIRGSCIEVPVPMDVYVSLLDHLRKQDIDRDPNLMVTSIIQKYLDDAGASLPRRSSEAKESAPDWSSDWIMFGAPPVVAQGKAQRLSANPRNPQSADW